MAERPKRTYLELVCEAFVDSNQKPMNTSEICQYVTKTYPFFNLNEEYWQKSVFSTLSNRDYFISLPKEKKNESVKYIPVDLKLQDESIEENELKSQIKWTEEECKNAKEFLKKQQEDHQNQIDELRYEYQMKLAQIDNEIYLINEMLSEKNSKN